MYVISQTNTYSYKNHEMEISPSYDVKYISFRDISAVCIYFLFHCPIDYIIVFLVILSAHERILPVTGMRG